MLLVLIRKNKMNICDIRITELVDQYMEQIGAMQERDMEVSSEFLEMAARLVYIKTVSLLPKPEEAEQLSRELTGQLLEYQECRRIAELLGDRLTFDSFPREQEKIDFDTAYRGHVSPEELFLAYRSAVGHGKTASAPEAGSVFRDRFPPDRQRDVAHHSYSARPARYRQGKVRAIFTADAAERSELVATFLAVLELVRGKRIRVEGENDRRCDARCPQPGKQRGVTDG